LTIKEDQQGRTWITNSFAVFYINSLEEKKAGSKKPLNQKYNRLILRDHEAVYVLNKRAYALHADKASNMWIGTIEGLYYYTQEDSLMRYEEDGVHQQNFIMDITESTDSVIWVSTKSNGVFGIKNNTTIYRYNRTNGLSSDNCKGLYWKDSLLWIATGNGLNYLNPKTGLITTVDRGDGLPSNDVNEVVVLKDTVWAGTSKGLVKFHKDILLHNEIPPPVYFTGLKIMDQGHILSNHIELKYDQNNLQIDFVGIGFRAKNTINYKYKMEGIDKDWIYTKTAYVRYPILNPGQYKFEVYAINEDAVESKIPAIMTVHVAEAW